jgi:hypothetical protein
LAVADRVYEGLENWDELRFLVFDIINNSLINMAGPLTQWLCSLSLVTDANGVANTI